MNLELHRPQAAGPLRIGATGHDTVEARKQFGGPRVLCRTPGSRPAWAVHCASGMFVGVYFDPDDRLGGRKVYAGRLSTSAE